MAIVGILAVFLWTTCAIDNNDLVRCLETTSSDYVPESLVRLASARFTGLRLRPVLYRLEIPAFEPLAARRAVREPLGVGFAPSLTVEKHPSVLSFGPPELPPDSVLLLARTIYRNHRLIS